MHDFPTPHVTCFCFARVHSSLSHLSHAQVTESGDEAIVQQLLDANATVDITTAESDRKAPSRSPLWIAARAQNTALVARLLSANANPNILSGENRTTPLLEVCAHLI